MSKTEIIENFEFAVDQIRNSNSKQATNDQKLKFYAYYKQAIVGKCNVAQPWAINAVERAKWDSWNSLGDMSKESAMIKYCELYMSING